MAPPPRDTPTPESRCWWCGDDALYVAYHDDEWGQPVTDRTRLFEKLCLEGFQAGLSWLTILRKRDNFRAAFDGFDPDRIAAYTERDVERLLGDAGIVRHRGKIESTINNARRVIDLEATEGLSFASFIWQYEPPADERPSAFDEATVRTLATSATSKRLSKDLKQRGFSFVGPTTAYAFMQAMGLVNDHVATCTARDRCLAARKALVVPTA